MAFGPRLRVLPPALPDALPEQPRLEVHLVGAAGQGEQSFVAAERVGEVVELEEPAEAGGRVEWREYVDVRGGPTLLDGFHQGLAAELPPEVASERREVRRQVGGHRV